MHRIEAAIGGTIRGVGMSDVSFTAGFWVLSGLAPKSP
jgi:hypothetical protein